MIRCLLLVVGGLSCLGFGWYVNTQLVCGLDVPISIEELEQYNRAVDNNSDLARYLEEIKGLYKQQFAQYNVRTISNKNIAAAHYQEIGNSDAARVITINADYYTSKAPNNYHRPVLLWILAHEIQHHINGDLHYEKNNRADNYRKELLADFQAGYAVACLTEVEIDFFEKVLPTILYPNENSETHPPREYRILAAQVGWMTGKQEVDPDSPYEKVIYSNGKISIGNKEKTDVINIGYTKFNNGGIYMGQCIDGKVNRKRNGKGIYIYHFNDIYIGYWVQDRRIGKGSYYYNNGDYYKGSWTHNETKGSYFYSNGTVYQGTWYKGKMHGQGILYRPSDNTTIKAGCWENGVYQGAICN